MQGGGVIFGDPPLPLFIFSPARGGYIDAFFHFLFHKNLFFFFIKTANVQFQHKDAFEIRFIRAKVLKQTCFLLSFKALKTNLLTTK